VGRSRSDGQHTVGLEKKERESTAPTEKDPTMKKNLKRGVSFCEKKVTLLES